MPGSQVARGRVPLRAVSFFKRLLFFTTSVQVSLLRYVSQGSSSLTCFFLWHGSMCRLVFLPGVLVARCLAAARQVASSRRKLEAR